MASKEISDEKEVENNVSLPQKKQTTSSFLPSYSKSYSETSIEMIKFDYTWTIKNFRYLCDNLKILKSPSFPKNNQYMIQMELPLNFPNLQNYNNQRLYVIKLYLLTAESFNGTCTTTISRARTIGSSNSISGCMSNMKMLCEYSFYEPFSYTDSLTIYCKFQICYNLKNTSINTYDLSPPTVSKDLKSLEDSTCDKIKNKESITLILSNTKTYNISKKLLCDASNYFKNICIMHEVEEKDLTKELNATDMPIFEKMLFIIIGIQTVELYDYCTVTQLLSMAVKYDVQTVKSSCEYYLLSHININNALELMHLTISSYAKLLETHLIIFIKLHMKEILNPENLNDKSKIMLNKIMKVLEKYDTFQKHETITHFNLLTVESHDDC
ncbi:protein maternal effect lethal 26-like [Solenopsis invicta]|uniref:protein maternal effect lethal 26-like n=1 Tax=Solenopsis invicta TaxID=13686 RepID=UPI00193E829B|nr:protein maternal effect lethal 26-like [Solenopsis invicta]